MPVKRGLLNLQFLHKLYEKIGKLINAPGFFWLIASTKAGKVKLNNPKAPFRGCKHTPCDAVIDIAVGTPALKDYKVLGTVACYFIINV